MAKKSDKTKMEPESKAESKCICQFCKHHSNKPSTCRLDDKFIGRKTPGCSKFKER